MKLALKKNLNKLIKSQPLPYWEIAEFMADNALSVPQVVQETGTLKTTVYYIWNTYSNFKTINGRKNIDLKWLEDKGYSWSVIKQLGQCKQKDQRKKVIKVLRGDLSMLPVKKIKEFIKAASLGEIDQGLKKNHDAARIELENEYIAMTGIPFQKITDEQLKIMRQRINKYLDTQE